MKRFRTHLLLPEYPLHLAPFKSISGFSNTFLFLMFSVLAVAPPQAQAHIMSVPMGGYRQHLTVHRAHKTPDSSSKSEWDESDEKGKFATLPSNSTSPVLLLKSSFLLKRKLLITGQNAHPPACYCDGPRWRAAQSFTKTPTHNKLCQLLD